MLCVIEVGCTYEFGEFGDPFGACFRWLTAIHQDTLRISSGSVAGALMNINQRPNHPIDHCNHKQIVTYTSLQSVH